MSIRSLHYCVMCIGFLLNTLACAGCGDPTFREIEYSELKDMGADAQTQLFCEYKQNMLVQEQMYEIKRSSWQGEMDIRKSASAGGIRLSPMMTKMHEDTYNSMEEYRRGLEMCKKQVERVERLLRAKNIEPPLRTKIVNGKVACD